MFVLIGEFGPPPPAKYASKPKFQRNEDAAVQSDDQLLAGKDNDYRRMDDDQTTAWNPFHSKNDSD